MVCVTSPGLLFDAVQARAGRAEAQSWVLEAAFPARRATPLVTVLDGHPHTLAFLAGINQVRAGASRGVAGSGSPATWTTSTATTVWTPTASCGPVSTCSDHRARTRHPLPDVIRIETYGHGL